MPAKPVKIPAPLGGWNTRDPISSMNPMDAIQLDNMIVDTDGVRFRPGYTEYVDHSGDYVNSLIPWKTQFGERFLSADKSGSNHRLFDITSSTASTIKTGYMRSVWDSITFNGSLGLVNGADNPQKLDFTPGLGVKAVDMSISGPSNPAKLSVIHAHKERSYFATGDEPAFWYSQVESLGGTLTKFPIDRVSLTGGNVIELSTWSRDGGSGPDDYIVIFLDTGEVLVYQGSDPSDANDWSIVGRYSMGRVLSVTEYGGKIHAVTEEDYNILPDDLLTKGVRKPSKLSGAARDAVRKYGGQWQMFIDPAAGLRIVNVPSPDRQQHVLNLRTSGPSRFTIQANVWGRYKGDIYFGGLDGKVYKLVENTDDAGTAFSWAVQQAFTDLGTPLNKNIPNYRPFWTTQGSFTNNSGLAFDYNARSFIQSLETASEGPSWDTSSWDTTDWGTGNPAKSEWLMGAGRGQNVSILQHGTTTRSGTFHHTDYRVEVSDDIL